MSDTSDNSKSVGPYLVHTAGPDDVEHFDTWAEACIYSQEVNAHALLLNETSRFPGWIRLWATPYLATDWNSRSVKQISSASLAALIEDHADVWEHGDVTVDEKDSLSCLRCGWTSEDVLDKRAHYNHLANVILRELEQR